MSESYRARSDVATQRIDSFCKRFGPEHLYLAYHAAFPLALTPDLLYHLWADFQYDTNNTVLNIPWVAVADLLLSSLCDEVGHELYEMDTAVRTSLLAKLKSDPRFSQQRINELSDFLIHYVQQHLHSDDPDLQDFAQVQYWAALAYTRPNDAARELAKTLLELYPAADTELMRLSTIIETLADPLAEFVPLLRYARGMTSFVQGDVRAAAAQLDNLLGPDGKVQVEGLHLGVPDEILEEIRDMVAQASAPAPQTDGLEPAVPETPAAPSHDAQPALPELLQQNGRFEAAQEAGLECCEEALRIIEQALNQYQQDYDQAEQTLRDLRTSGVHPFEDSFQERKTHLDFVQDVIERTNAIMDLLHHMQQVLRDERYKEVLFLTTNRLLRNPGDDRFSGVAEQVDQLAQVLRTTLSTAVEFARALGQTNDSGREQAQQFLEHEVLRRYPDYPQARELQREWEHATIEQGIHADAEDYAILTDQVEALRRDFWSDDKARQDRSEARARALDLAAILSSPGLNQARAAVGHLATLGPADETDLHQREQTLRERELRRRLLRLNITLYCNNQDDFDHELRTLQAVGASPQALAELQHEHAAIDAVHKALEYFEDGEWESSLDAIRPARTLHPRAPRITLLIKRLQEATETAVSLEGLFQEATGNLLTLERERPASDALLKQVHQQLITIKDTMAPYTYFTYIYTKDYQELTEDYLNCWQTFTSSMLENWRYRPEQASQLIEQYNDVIAIAPPSAIVQPLIRRLEGRVRVVNAQQSIRAARLSEALDFLTIAAQSLPADDQPLKDAQDSLTKKRQLVRFNCRLAMDFETQNELSSAYKSISQALVVDRQDEKALDLKAEIETRMKSVREQASQALRREQANLEEALQLWENVCARHRDGSYSDENKDAPFTEWRDDVSRRLETALRRIERVTADFEGLCLVLAGVAEPDWEEFSAHLHRVRIGMGVVEPGMQHKLSGIKRATELLDDYRSAYQDLERLLGQPRRLRAANWERERANALQVLATAHAKIKNFDPAAEQLLQVLAAVVTASFENINKVNRLIRAIS